MENPNTGHERFGELSALAIIGQVSNEEYRELKEHLKSCAVCQQEHDALAKILLSELPLAHEERYSDLEPWGVAQQTQASLRSPVSAGLASLDDLGRNAGSVLNWRMRLQGMRTPPVYAYAAAVLLFVTVGALTIRVMKESEIDKLRSAQVAALNEEIVGLRNQIHDVDKRARHSLPTGPSIPAITRGGETGGWES